MSDGSVKDLEINIPLGNLQAAKLGTYVNVSAYKRLSVAFYSDTSLNLIFTASHDSIKSGPVHTYTTHPYAWETANIPVFLPYIRLDYEKNDPNAPNNELIVVCTGHLRRGMNVEQPQEKPKRRWSSILHASPKNKEKEEVPIKEIKQESSTFSSSSNSPFPALILPNTLFVGGKGNKIIALPPGQPGQVLGYTDHGIRWI